MPQSSATCSSTSGDAPANACQAFSLMARPSAGWPHAMSRVGTSRRRASATGSSSVQARTVSAAGSGDVVERTSPSASAMTSCTYAANAGVASAPDICASWSMAESQSGNLSRLDATQATSWAAGKDGDAMRSEVRSRHKAAIDQHNCI